MVALSPAAPTLPVDRGARAGRVPVGSAGNGTDFLGRECRMTRSNSALDPCIVSLRDELARMNRVVLLAALLPPASTADIRRVRRAIPGKGLPPDLLHLYEWSAGVRRLFAVEGVARDRRLVRG